MKIIVVKDYAAMSEQAFALIKELVTNNPKATIGFATGSTPIGLYQLMMADHQATGTSYQGITALNLDEYLGLPAGHAESYATFMRKNLFDGIDINLSQTYIPDGTASDPAAEAVRYEKLLSEHPVDLQITGIGSNGHIGFNEPGTPFTSRTSVVDLAASTIADNARFFADDLSQVPTQAISMGIASILSAKTVLLLASGENKAEAIYQAIKGPIIEQMPASSLQNHPDAIFILDEAAASKL